MQVIDPLVTDQRLIEAGFTLNHVDQVVHYTPLAAHDEIQVAQPHIEIDHYGLVAA